MIPDNVREKAEKWLKAAYNKRVPRTRAEFCRRQHISTSSLRNIEIELKNNGASRIDKAIDLLKGFSEEEIALFKRKVYEDAMEKDSSAKDKELFARLENMLIDKSEKKVIHFDAAEIARIRNEAKRELETEGFGGGEVRPKPPLLS